MGRPKSSELNYLNSILVKRGVRDFLSIKSTENNSVILIDSIYGEYAVSLTSFSGNSKTPLHNKRKSNEKLNTLKQKFVGSSINGILITDVFYGPDKGYKNRSFYFSHKCLKNHEGVSTYAHLTRHKKSFGCGWCNKTQHGERSKEEGKLKKRSPTYLIWLKYKNSLPEEYRDFTFFRNKMGDKPFKKAKINIINGVPLWINLNITEDSPDLDLIASAIRQAFRNSSFYKEIIKNSRIETEDGPRYRCAKCLGLFKRKEIQVDHIDPVQKLDGTPLKKEELIDRIWTNKIQVLDRKCHVLKSNEENKCRRKARASGTLTLLEKIKNDQLDD